MTFIVATNVIASRPSERRPTGMPHACAKIFPVVEFVNSLLEIFGFSRMVTFICKQEPGCKSLGNYCMRPDTTILKTNLLTFSPSIDL